MVNTKKKILFTLLIIILALSIVASTGLMLPNRDSDILGIAYLDGPLVGATVMVYGSSGNIIAEFPNSTYDSGVFIIKVPWPLFHWSAPKDIKIAITGGTLNNEPFTGTIYRYIQDLDENQVYGLNAVTTLIAAYKDQHSQTSYAESEEVISNFLAIPNSTDIQTVQNIGPIANSHFSHYVFMREADENGGLSVYMNSLVSEIDQGVQTHSFKDQEPLTGVAGELLGWFGGNLANGAVSYLGGQAMGWAMNLLGYQSAEDKILEQLSVISDKLDQLDQKLDSLKNQLNSLSNQISELKSAISATETDLNKRISEIASYDPISKIQSAYSQLDIYAKCKPGEVSAETIKGWESSVLDPTTGTYYALTSLDNFIMGHVIGNEPGLMEVLCDSALNKLSASAGDHYGRAYRTKVYNIAQGMSDYFQKLLFIEMKGLTIICEAHHSRNEITPVVQYLKSYWQPRLESQIELYVAQMEKFAILSERDYYLEFPNMGSIPPTKQATLQNYWQQVYHMNVPNVAEILPEVDRFADQALNGSGKFVARVLYTQTIKRDLIPKDIMPVFQNIQTGKTYSTAGNLTKVPLTNSDRYYCLYKYTLDLPAGNYKLISPTTVFSSPVLPGWKINIDATLEGWSLKDALTMSQGSYLGQQGYIEVANDKDGHPYGYWGGQWLDIGIA